MSHAEQSAHAGKTIKIKAWVKDIGGKDFQVEHRRDRMGGGGWLSSAQTGNMTALKYAARGRPSDDNEVLYGKVGAFGHLVHLGELDIPLPKKIEKSEDMSEEQKEAFIARVQGHMARARTLWEGMDDEGKMEMAMAVCTVMGERCLEEAVVGMNGDKKLLSLEVAMARAGMYGDRVKDFVMHRLTQLMARGEMMVRGEEK